MADYWQPQAPFVGSQWIHNSQPCVSSSSDLRGFMYAFPKPRISGRIMKPRSAGNSPSSAGRRRTATMHHSSPVCQSVPTQDYQAPLTAAALVSAMHRGRQTRPISWHPVSAEPENLSSQYYPSCTTMTAHDLPAMQVYPQLQTTTGTLVDESMLQSFAPPEVPIPQQTIPLTTTQSQLPIQDSTSFLQIGDPQIDAVSWNMSASGYPAFVQPVSNDWPFDMMSMNQNIPSVGVPGSNYESASSPGHLTEPATPDFLPIQQFGDDTNSQSAASLEKPDPEDELVGMGLYSNPDTLTEESSHGCNGKGLKLEETFTPSSDNEADDNDAEGDDDRQDGNEIQNATEGAVQAQTRPDSNYETQQRPTKPAESMMQKSFFFEDDNDFQQHALANTRSSFNFGSTSCMNYGYGWI